MNYLDILNARFACKKFDPTRSVSKEDKAFILEAGRLSPSSFGLEPWKFVAISNKALREQLKPHCWGQPQITDSSFIVVILSRLGHNFRGKTDYVAEKIARRKLPQEMQDAYAERVTVHLSAEETTQWAKRQCYIALSNMLNAAQSLGISSCPIEGFYPEEVKAVLEKETNIDFKDFDISGAICAFGYSAMERPEKFRSSKEEVIIEI
ncbi:NAD(P)H-dependent oxidoreductase [Fangia hongkongensis]|uniref:NAD(P)H-dependent oxidoreductase n=2 Tax=Fangia hongkongensis TaxID=270495 RepID=UPI00036D22A3|nr:NAD(P)H-dependent oxidoreductase [Fangia hongkongensis]